MRTLRLLSLLCVPGVAAAAPPPKAMRAPLHVTGDARAVHVHAEGSGVGEVAARTGAVAGLAVRVDPDVATLPVWVHADGVEPEELLRRVAAALGLLATEEPATSGPVVWRVSPAAAADPPLDPARRRRIVATGAPDELAALMQNHILSSRGRATPFSARSAVILEDTPEHVDAAERLAGMLTPNPGTAPLLVTPPPRAPAGPAPCRPAAPLPPWRPLDPVNAVRGEPAGQALVVVAALQARNVVVGCGGDRPAWASFDRTTLLEELADGLGLWSSARASQPAADAAPGRRREAWRQDAAGSPLLQVLMDRREQAALARWSSDEPPARVLLFPVRKPETYTGITALTGGVVTVLPTLGWVAVECADPAAAEAVLRQLSPKVSPELPPSREVHLGPAR
ncbi:MAG: hypothetical protein HY904_03720 [Deltaproteobacteria bacterium]|nr:hypothetical protein [Deltaproteobacteria bacterium]